MEDRPTVFYVDDNPKSRRLLTSILKECGFEVVTAGDPVEALGRCGIIWFDLALLDYQMPSLSGPQLAKEMKYIHPDVPIVMISGCDGLPESELLFVDAYFGSGTALDDLIATMRMLLTRKPLAGTNAPPTSESFKSIWM
jgi:CheY-like chemotaxis protein